MTIQEKARVIFEAILEGGEVCAKKSDDSFVRLEGVTVAYPGTEKEILVGYYANGSVTRIDVGNKEVFKRVRLCDASTEEVKQEAETAGETAAQ